MTTPRTYSDFLEDIRTAATKAQAFAAGMSYESFVADEKTAFAVVRALEILGEQLSEFRRKYVISIQECRGGQWRAYATS
jgi:uncharacterized protein with HEPN domain